MSNASHIIPSPARAPAPPSAPPSVPTTTYLLTNGLPPVASLFQGRPPPPPSPSPPVPPPSFGDGSRRFVFFRVFCFVGFFYSFSRRLILQSTDSIHHFISISFPFRFGFDRCSILFHFPGFHRGLFGGARSHDSRSPSTLPRHHFVS